MDYYLKFESESESDAALGKAMTLGPGDVEIVTYAAVAGMCLDIIGLIYEPTGETCKILGPDGGEIDVPGMAPLEGWHVNLRGDSLPDGLVKYAITPTNPRRVWA